MDQDKEGFGYAKCKICALVKHALSRRFTAGSAPYFVAAFDGHEGLVCWVVLGTN